MALYLQHGNSLPQKRWISIKDFLSKSDQIRRELTFTSHLLRKFLTENFIFCAVLALWIAVRQSLTSF